MASVYLVDDHEVLLDGLLHLFEDCGTFKICGQSTSARDALAKIPEARPDLVLLDLTLPDKNGISVIKDLQKLCAGVPVLVLSMHEESLYAERVVRAGGKGYVMKDSAGTKLIDAMKTVLDGGVALSPEASTQIFEALTNNPGQRSKLHDLTDREFEVFELIGKGMDVHEIGDRLAISPRTVDAHRTHIREKLNLPNSQELLLYAVRWTETGELSEPGQEKSS